MQLKQFTNNFQEAILKAQSNALELNHQFVEELHLMQTFLYQENGIIPFILQDIKADLNTLKINIMQEIENLPKIKNKENIEFSPNLIKTLHECERISKNYGDKFIASEFFLIAILNSKNLVSDFLKSIGVTKNKILNTLENIRNNEKIADPNFENYRQALKKYTIDITLKAEKGYLDPVIGRDDEIRRTIQVLQRRTKNNPVLIGEPGVGKTAIIEGLAQRIINQEVPEGLKNRRVLALDIGALLAGSKFRGEFEERLKDILNNIASKKEEIILFIDELHTITNAGKSEGAIDASNMLKPALARGELHCVGATTIREYKLYIEKDAALERRFQKILIIEPSVENTIAILRGLKEKYELHHHVQITDPAIVAAAELSQRYISDRNLPDKAIDLIDEAASSIRIQIDSKPELLDRLERNIIQLKLEKKALKKESDESSIKRLNTLNHELEEKEKKYFSLEKKWNLEKNAILKTQKIKTELEKNKLLLEKAKRNGNLEKMSELQYGKIPELEKKLKLSELSIKTDLLKNCVTKYEIAEVLSRWTGIPVFKIVESERNKLLRMEKYLHKKIIGQNIAVNVICNAIRRNRSGLSNPERPIGSFLFIGPTGVGKTALCHALADLLFDNKNAIIRIDMSEFMEKHSVSRLIGAPPGYIGYEEGGYLTELIRRNPYSIILFDEIEKAHSDIFNILLQVLDDGRLTDNHGKTVNFKNSIIIMTSNLASNIIQENVSNLLKIKNLIMKIIKNHFRPEFINRIDEIVLFHSLSKLDFKLICKIQLKELYKKLKNLGFKIKISESAIDYIAEKAYDPLYGARPLRRFIQKEIENILAEKILSKSLDSKNFIKIDKKENNLFIYQ